VKLKEERDKKERKKKNKECSSSTGRDSRRRYQVARGV
jgi:hypothetical protein